MTINETSPAPVAHLATPTIPCPPWCEDHRGAQPNVTAPIPGGIPADASAAPIGEHRVSFATSRADDEHREVYISQPVSPAGLWGMNIYLQDGYHGRSERARVLNFTTTEARALGAALIAAADTVEAVLPDRCSECQCAVAHGVDVCWDCVIDARQKRVASIQLLDAADKFEQIIDES